MSRLSAVRPVDDHQITTMGDSMATSGSKRTGRLVNAQSTGVKRDKATGSWAKRDSATGKFTELKKSGTFKSVRTEK